jgi:hypothetical protein
MKKCLVKVLSIAPQKELKGVFPLQSKITANILDCDNNLEIIDENGIIELPLNDKNNVNYEPNKYFRLDLEKMSDHWVLIKYYGEASYLLEA